MEAASAVAGISRPSTRFSGRGGLGSGGDPRPGRAHSHLDLPTAARTLLPDPTWRGGAGTGALANVSHPRTWTTALTSAPAEPALRGAGCAGPQARRRREGRGGAPDSGRGEAWAVRGGAGEGTLSTESWARESSGEKNGTSRYSQPVLAVSR